MNKPANYPHWVSQTLQQGFSALQKKDVTTAGNCCRKILSSYPQLAQAHFLIGLIATEMKDKRTAISAFGSVTKLEPGHAAAWAQLARIFISMGQINRSDKALQQAVSTHKGEPLVADLIGSVYQQLGDQLESNKWYSAALKQDPENIYYLINYANSLVYLGNTDAAEKNLNKVLKLQAGNPQAHWILSSSRKAENSAHLQQMQKLLQAGEYRDEQAKSFIYYAIGKEFEDLEDWPLAFEAFSKGAAARRKTLDFDEKLEQATFLQLEKTFTRQWLNSNKETGITDNSPIFVLGQPRTGTTLIERIISSHSQVSSAGELQQFGLAVRRLGNYQGSQRFSPELFIQAARIPATQLGRAYLDTSLKMRGNLPHFVDKLPSNYLYLPLILKALPNAKIIHLTRQPMDACFASFKQLFADAYPHSYQQDEMARHHIRYRHLMQIWRERFPGRFLDVSYEETTRDLETNARRIVNYLELPWEDSCLNFHQQKSAVTTASAAQVREPVHTRSVDRWKRYKDELQPMQATLSTAGIEF